MQITLSGFLQCFYTPERISYLSGSAAKWKTAAFFVQNAVPEDERGSIDLTEDTYRNQYNGKREFNGTFWDSFLLKFDEEELQRTLFKAIRSEQLPDLAAELGFTADQGANIDKDRFTRALAIQYHAIMKGKGIAESIIEEEYRKIPKPEGYNIYIHRAIQKYQMMTLLGGECVPLQDYYITNKIGRTPTVVARKNDKTIIQEVTLDQLRRFDRNMVTNQVILIAASGFGKTIMMQHLFIDSAKKFLETSLLPVYVQLRDFNFLTQDLYEILLKCVRHFDADFPEEKLIDLLYRGKCQILLDGLDEMDPSEKDEFQRKLTEFKDRHPDNQIVITSRDCEAIKGIKFPRLYILPFDNEQTEKLVDKLLTNEEDPTWKEKIYKFMDRGFIKKGDIFATNPMLVTFAVNNRELLDEFEERPYRYYQLIYDTIVTRHDQDKTAFSRIYQSVDNSGDFKKVFREFCAISYRDRVFQFTTQSFEKYFGKLKTKEEVRNPAKLTEDLFKRDACSSASMMYEKLDDIYYIEPAFQAYLFAEYYYQADETAMRDMGKKLWNIPIYAYPNSDAFKMLYQLSKEKFEALLIYPFLESIFRGKDQNGAFLEYLRKGYSDFHYTFLEKDKLKATRLSHGLESISFVPRNNEPTNLMMYLVLLLNEWPTEFTFTTDRPEMAMEMNTVARYTFSPSSLFYNNGKAVVRETTFQYNRQEIPETESEESTGTADKQVDDIDIGYTVHINLNELKGHQPDIESLIKALIESMNAAYQTFLLVQEYYRELSNQIRENR